MRRGLSSFMRHGRAVKLPVRVHSWLHSYPNTKPAKKQSIYLEINGEGRSWTTKEKMVKDLGPKGFVLYMRDYRDMFVPVGEAYE
jgi:NADH:ubiquinone oxidoreductase subunit